MYSTMYVLFFEQSVASFFDLFLSKCDFPSFLFVYFIFFNSLFLFYFVSLSNFKPPFMFPFLSSSHHPIPPPSTQTRMPLSHCHCESTVQGQTHAWRRLDSASSSSLSITSLED